MLNCEKVMKKKNYVKKTLENSSTCAYLKISDLLAFVPLIYTEKMMFSNSYYECFCYYIITNQHNYQLLLSTRVAIMIYFLLNYIVESRYGSVTQVKIFGSLVEFLLSFVNLQKKKI